MGHCIKLARNWTARRDLQIFAVIQWNEKLQAADARQWKYHFDNVEVVERAPHPAMKALSQQELDFENAVSLSNGCRMYDTWYR